MSTPTKSGCLFWPQARSRRNRGVSSPDNVGSLVVMAYEHAVVGGEAIAEPAGVIEEIEILRHAAIRLVEGLEPGPGQALVTEQGQAKEREPHPKAIAGLDGAGDGRLRQERAGHLPRHAVDHRHPVQALRPVEAPDRVVGTILDR